MNEPMTMKVANEGLKVHCDECGFDIEGVTMDELEGYVGHTCPKCGANMLTRHDFEVAVALAAFVNDDANTLAEKLVRWARDTRPGQRHVALIDENGRELAHIDR